MDTILIKIRDYLGQFYFPHISWTDVLDILILAYLLYRIIFWLKDSRARTLLNGIGFVFVFLIVAYFLRLNTLLWIAQNLISVFLLAIIVLFQPEIRRALDQLGRKKWFSKLLGPSEDVRRLNDKTIFEIVKTASELSKAKTGALIVFEHDTPLGEYEETGISIDAEVSKALLINIFEKNTPLHDGAVIIRNNRIVAATCYLPLTDNGNINKALGTRHRAGLGISEVSDSMTLIVSEETGGIAIAQNGVLYRDLDEEGLRRQLEKLQDPDNSRKSSILKKGGKKHEDEN